MKPEQFGSYTLLRRIGKGGMAEVFQARAQSSMGFEKLLAVKRLLPPYSADKQIISMLADEARLSVWLQHPNIVQVFDFGKVGATYYIAMEYVDGCDLCDLIRPQGKIGGQPLDLSTAIYVMMQLAEALDYAHRRKNHHGEPMGIIHRDVSPHNVLISKEGLIKLADFGLARATISVHHSFAGVVRGKFSYMPMEQAMGRQIDHRIDLFAAGATFYEALTGKKPYTSTSLAEQIKQLEKQVPPPSTIIADIPEEIDDLVMQAMSPELEMRYRTAEDLANDLRDALIKRSNPQKEAANLAELVKQIVSATEPPAYHMPLMSLVDIPISQRSLIKQDLLEVKRATMVLSLQEEPAEGKSGGIPPGQILDLDDEPEEELHTTQYQQTTRRSARQRHPLQAATASMSGRRTVNRRKSQIEDDEDLSALSEEKDTLRDPEEAGVRARRALQMAQGEQHAPREANREANRSPRRPGSRARGKDAPLKPLSGEVLIQAPPREALLQQPSAEPPLLQREAPLQQPSAEPPLLQREFPIQPLRLDRSLTSSSRPGPGRQRRWMLVLGGLLLFNLGVAAGWMIHRITSLDGPTHSAGERSGSAPTCPTCPDAAEMDPDHKGGANLPLADGGGDRAPRGFLSVTTNVPAHIYLDDQTLGALAPLKALSVTAGLHRVRAHPERNSSQLETQWITIRAGKTSELSFVFK